MDSLYTRCAGMDVHKKTVVVCLRILDESGQHETIRTFGTMTPDLLELADWLREAAVTHVAMESTGVYWKPIFNILEADFDVILANARHIKFVPGRKTDLKDAQWIAQLLQHGLLKASYVPTAPQRALRDLVRYRTKLIQERTQEINRIQKVLEDANLKLASVASDIMGVSAREMLAQLCAGQEDPAALAQLARGRMRRKLKELERALTGRLGDHHRLLLRLHLSHIETLNDLINQLECDIDRDIDTMKHEDEVTRLDEIPGVGRHTAQAIVAELGTDMHRFPSAGHAASWAGLAPGRNESAGRNRSARTVKGNRHLKNALIQAAHSVRSSKNTYLGVLYRRLSRRRGSKRAAVAVARSILVIAYHMLRNGTHYVDLGPDHFDQLHQRDQERLKQRLIKRLNHIGYEVTLHPVTA